MLPALSNRDRGSSGRRTRLSDVMLTLLIFAVASVPPTALAEAPAERPAYGLTVPVRIVRVRDGDTVEVSLRGSDRIYALRLIDCWAPESRGPERTRGLASKANAERLIAAARPDLIAVYIPAPKDSTNLLAALTFDRIPAWLYLDAKRTLNAEQVKGGFATKEKQRK